MAEETKDTFVRINVKSGQKREIDILAASQQRNVYEIVDDMLRIYKAVLAKPNRKKIEHIAVEDVIGIR